MNWVVMVTHNSWPLTECALDSALAQDIGDVGVLIIENHSTDGTKAKLCARPKGLLIAHLNSSVAACWNYALGWIFDGAEDFALVINNDVELRADTYRLLVENGGDFVTGVGVGERRQMNICDPSLDSPHPDYSCFLIRKRAWELAGPFDERCKIAYCEDSFHHLAMHRKGIKAISIAVPFFHYSSGTLKSAIPSERERIEKAAQENRELFYKENGCYPGTPEYEELFK